MSTAFDFVTDTATLCIFDLACLKHRLADEADWWTIPVDEIAEVNAGNALFLGLGTDGKYKVEVVGAPPSVGGVAAVLKCPTGRLFVGCGEEVTGGGLEPQCLRGGAFVAMTAGNYKVTAARTEWVVQLHFAKIPADVIVRNDFNKGIRL